MLDDKSTNAQIAAYISAYISDPRHHTGDERSEDGMSYVTIYPVTEYTRADWRGGMLARLAGKKRTGASFIAPISALCALAALAIVAA